MTSQNGQTHFSRHTDGQTDFYSVSNHFGTSCSEGLKTDNFVKYSVILLYIMTKNQRRKVAEHLLH